MNEKQTDNSHQKNEGMSKEKADLDYNRQEFNPNGPKRAKRPRKGDGQDKSRKVQVMAKINGKSDDSPGLQENERSNVVNETLEDEDEKVKQKSKYAPMQESQLMKFFKEKLKDIYWAEKALTKVTLKMMQKATSVELIEALSVHLEETYAQVERLEKVFASINERPLDKKCEAMEGLIKEAESIMESCEAGAMCDAEIVSAAQKIEHYEIASYGTLCQFAEAMTLPDAVTLLAATLKEEYSTDEILAEIAIALINPEFAELEA